jgi:undecaprenyl-diphosphatase
MNNQIFFFFYNLAHQSDFFDKLIVFFAVYFPFVVVFTAGIFLFRRFSRNPDPLASGLLRKTKKILSVFLSPFLAYFLATILKIIFHTMRPFLALPNVHALFSETGFAFPSGHAAFFSALCVALFFTHKKAGYVFMFFALLIGLARIMAGVHFPVDILGGFILGSLVAFSLKNVYPIS